MVMSRARDGGRFNSTALHQNYTKYLGSLWSTHRYRGEQSALFSMERHPNPSLRAIPVPGSL
jgi:hypothetical protein